MKSHVSKAFLKRFDALPDRVREEARKAYRQFKKDMHYPSLEFKVVLGRDGNSYYSIRVGIHYRALADMRTGELYWFWIGTHAEYDKLLM